MADKIPVRARLAAGVAIALQEFEVGETIPLIHGGTGAITAAAARVSLVTVAMYRQDTAPVDGMVDGDYWYKTDTHQIFQYINAAWVSVGDSIQVPTYSGAGTPSVADQLLKDMHSGVHSTGMARHNGFGVVTANGATGIDVSAGSCYLRATNDKSADLEYIEWDAVVNDDLSSFLNQIVYAYIDHVTGATVQYSTVNPDSTDSNQTICKLAAILLDGTGILHTHDLRVFMGNHAQEMTILHREVFGTLIDGCLVSESGSLNVAVSSGGLYLAGFNNKYVSSFDSSGADTFITWYRDGVGGWVSTTGVSQLDNTNYDNGSGTLVALAVNKWKKDWVFRDAEGDVQILYGQGEYGSEQDALDAELPTIPSELQSEHQVFLIGSWVCQEGNSSGIVTDLANRFQGASIASHSHSLDKLSNVTITTPSDNEGLAYDISSGHWVNRLITAETANKTILLVQKASAGTITKGTPVYITGYNPSGVYEVEAADASSGATMSAGGISSEDITNTASSLLVVLGLATNLDTSSWLDGDELYVADGGGLTTVKPTGTSLIQKVAEVMRSHVSAGALLVVGAFRSNEVPNIPEGQVWLGNASGVATAINFTAANLTDVTITSAVSGEVLVWNGTAFVNQSLATAGISAVGHTHTKVAITDFVESDYVHTTGDESIAGIKTYTGSLIVTTTPTTNNEVANKGYVDSIAQGIDSKYSTRVATTANITLSGTQTIDDISVIAEDRVLVKNQTLPEENGLYVCAAGAWSRASDADTWANHVSAFTFVEEGTNNGDTGWVCTSDAGGTLGTTAITWSQFNSAGDFTADELGLTLTGTVFSLVLDGTTLVKSGSGLKVGELVDANISASAAIALSKLTTVTIDRVLVSSGAGLIIPSAVTVTELGFLTGVTSSIQTQLGNKSETSHTHALDDLSDAEITTPLEGELLARAGGTFKNQSPEDLNLARNIYDAIDQILTSTAVVDSVIYDTTQDSDSGAWRFKKKSWYSEATPSGNPVGRFADETAARAGGGLENDWYARTGTTEFFRLDASGETEIYRAGRSEFPKIALIVAELDTVIIYDLTDSEPSMWMVFEFGGTDYLYSSNVSSVFMLQGLLVWGYAGNGMTTVDFANDGSHTLSAGGEYRHKKNVAGRNSGGGLIILDTGKVINNTVNDVAMTVLPDAPTDSVTGLKVPTIAVATDGGVSVITDGGDVYDSLHVDAIGKISIVGGRMYVSRSGDTFTRFGISDDISSINADGWSSLLHNLYEVSIPPVSEDNTNGIMGHKTLGTTDGIQTLEQDVNDITQSMVNHTTKDYATGWMVGDIRGCLLADSNVGSIVGTELVTNGTFDTTITGFTSPDSSTASWDASQRFKSTATSNALGIQYTLTGLIAGETYVVSLSVEPLAGTDTNFLSVRIDDVVKGVVLETSHAVETTHGRTFIATATSHVLKVNGTSGSVTVGETCMFDNVTCRLSIEDRSTKNNGVQVFGTIAKSLINANGELVDYSGFSASNYLEQPYNADLDFGTTDWKFCFWLNESANTVDENIFTRGYLSGGWGGSVILGNVKASGALKLLVTDDAFATKDEIITANAIDDGQDHFVEMFKSGGSIYIHVDGVQWGTTAVVNAAGSLSNTAATLMIGSQRGAAPLTNGKLSLFRVSSTVLTADQRKHIYETERQMIVNKCLLDGDSNAVTALNFNGKRNLLSVGTNWGRTDLNNLVRVDSEATAVGALTSITYDGDIVSNGGTTGSDIFIPELDLRAELIGRELEVVEDNEWKDVDTLLNSWVNIGGSNYDAQYRKVGDRVELRGVLDNGTATAGTDLFVLPVGYRPTNTSVAIAFGQTTYVRINIFNTGVVEIGNALTAGDFFSLDDISFSIS